MAVIRLVKIVDANDGTNKADFNDMQRQILAKISELERKVEALEQIISSL